MQLEIIELNMLNIDQLNLNKYVGLLNQLSDTVYSSITDIKTSLINILLSGSKIFILGSLEIPKGTVTLLIEQKLLHNCKCVGHIEDFVVDFNLRGQGYGESLLNKCLEVSKTNNCYKVVLHCDDKLVPFYSKMGFDKTNGMRLNLY